MVGGRTLDSGDLGEAAPSRGAGGLLQEVGVGLSGEDRGTEGPWEAGGGSGGRAGHVQR